MRYTVCARNNGVPEAGLSPVWNSFKSATLLQDETPPDIFPMGDGIYYFDLSDLEIDKSLFGVIDFSSTITDANERYLPVDLALRQLNEIRVNTANTAASFDNYTRPVSTVFLGEFALGDTVRWAFSSHSFAGLVNTSGDEPYTYSYSVYESGTAYPAAPILSDTVQTVTGVDAFELAEGALLLSSGDGFEAGKQYRLLQSTRNDGSAILYLFDVVASPSGSAPTVEEIRQEMDSNSTKLAAIKAKSDLIPASPAAVGSAMTLANNAVSAAAIAPDAGTELAAALLGTALGTGEWATVTVTDALKAAWADGYGKVVLDLAQQKLFLYAPDGTTLVKTFNLNSATAPTTRIPA
jgi:hypothetical protein